MHGDNLPCKPGIHLKPAVEGDEVNNPTIPYQKAIGILIFITICCRPDIAYPVCQTSQHMAKYTEEHFTAVKKIFRYLKNTKDLGITYSKGSKRPEIEAYVDASFAEEVGRKSASGGSGALQ